MIAGAGEADITPDFEVELCGFALREQPATGVLDPIFAKALYLDDDAGTRLLWVVADVLALDEEIVSGFRQWAGDELGIPPGHVMLAATHTHNAPGVIRLNAAGARSDRFVSLLKRGMERAARDAVAAARKCELVRARGSLDLAIDRRNKPTKHVDPTVWSLGFRQAGGGPFVAAVLNYGMHPVALGHTERRISPDWCGGAAASLAEELSRGATPKPVVLVTNGACGNVNPPYHGATREQDFAWGRSVADAVGASLASATPVSDPRIGVRSASVSIALDWHDAAGVDALADRMIEEVASKSVWPVQFTAAVNAWREALKPVVSRGEGKTRDIELQAMRIGNVTGVSVNGEMFSRFTDDLRHASGTGDLFVIGYANRAYGYIPTREAYPEGGYEVETAHYFYNSFRPLPGALELLSERAAELVRGL